MLVACTLVAAAVLAQENKNNVKENASRPVVEELLAQPDGISIVRSESDGSLQVFARGSSSYDFGDDRDIRNKTKVAELHAKAALAKYLKEIVEINESATSGEGRLSKAILTQTSTGDVVKKTVTRENMESIGETLSARAAAILSGIVTLRTVRIPAEGSRTSGEIQVTIGVSTKTLAAAAEAHNMITDSMNARRAIGDKVNTPKTSTPDNAKDVSGSNGSDNKKGCAVRTNKTLF